MTHAYVKPHKDARPDMIRNLLTKEHGGPARVIIPKRYAWKGAKFIREIVFLDRDILGFWEVRGYSNTADPWKEDRFS
jgi:DMSO/TMAO reductase YedYZ molybdopterin-dependent catalytic subunit